MRLRVIPLLSTIVRRGFNPCIPNGLSLPLSPPLSSLSLSLSLSFFLMECRDHFPAHGMVLLMGQQVAATVAIAAEATASALYGRGM